MKSGIWLDLIPLWGLFLITIAIVMLSIWVGTLLGDRRRNRPDHESEASLGTIIGSTLGLLGFLLVFTFGIAADLFQTRRELLLSEINAIGTTYLRAGLLLEPHKSKVRELLREYVDVRVSLTKLVSEPEQFEQVIEYSQSLQKRIWEHAEAIAEADRHSEIDSLFIDSLNNMIDLQTSRVTVFQYRIPMSIWYVLYFSTFISMLAVGYQSGISGKRSIKIGIVLAMTFSVVILLIADLDRSLEGSLRVSQKPMKQLQMRLNVSEEEQSRAGIMP